MGCASSSPGVYQFYEQSPGKRNIKTGYGKNQRSQLLQAIEYNDPCDFAVALEQTNLPINAELSEGGLFWMASHFCCRFNAFKVLDYVLRTAYVQDPKNYIRFVNEQTVQGFSCMHLCAIWNANQCLQLLLKFGGINLQIKDKIQATPYLTTINYKRNSMRSILKQYQDLGIAFLIVEHEKLSTGDILSLETLDTNNNKNKQNHFTPKLNNGVKQAFGNLFLQSQKQKQILAQKKKLQQQRENIRAQLKKIEEQQAMKQKQKIKKVEEQKKAKIQREVKQREEQLYKEMKKKQTELLRVKTDLSKIQEQKQESVLKEQIKKSEEFILKNQENLNSKIRDNKNAVEEVRESVMKNRKQRAQQPNPLTARPIKQQVGGVLPKQLQQLYDQAKRNGHFTDTSFPQTEASIGNTPKAKKFISDLAWLRPKQIFAGDYHLFDGIQPNDIKQGSLGVCYMLATLSTLAQYPDRIKNIFAFHDKQLGFYVLKILIHGQIQYVVVDDAIPCNKSTKSPLFAKPNGNQIWVCLVEKAWAKCIGNYMKAESMTPNHLMQDLTTCPSFGAWFKDKTQKTKEIDTHIRAHNIVVLTSVSDKKIEGIVNNHAYSLLNVHQHQGKNIYKIRNPWGKFQWNGLYNDKSSFWTQQLKKKVDFVDADDGIFFLSQSQLLQAFVYYSISITRINNKYSYVALKTKKDENKFYTFQLSEDQEINLRFVQKFNRMLDDEKYKYSPVIFQVGKIEKQGSVTFLTQGDNACFWGAKSVHADPQILKKYQKGKYFVRLSIQWNDESKYNTGIFSIFSSKQVTITQLSNQQGKPIVYIKGQKYWFELMKNFAIKKNTPSSKSNMDYIMTWMRGQMICYSYAKETQSQEKFQSKWTFEPSKFVNCTFAMDHKGGNDVKYIIGKGPQNANIGILRRILINQGCNSGSVYISATAL